LDCIDRRFAHLLLHAYDLKKIFYGLGSGLRQNLDWRDFKTLPCLLPPLPEQVAIVRFLDHVDGRVRRYIRSKQKLIKLLEEQKQVIIHHAVTRGLDPNVRLKPSGVEWLGDVPEHWDVAALRHRYSQCLGKMLDSKKITARNSLPYLRNTDIQWDRINVENLPLMDISPEEYDRYTVREKDLLVCEGGDVGRCALWSGEMSLCGFQKALHRLRPRNVNQDVPRFMYYILRAAAKCEAFNDGHLSTIAHLTGDKLRAHRFPFPRKEEQESLVSFLDATLNQIDEAISTTFSEVSLLREYRTRLISDVVTGKLDVRDIELPAADAEAPEECSDLPDIETALEDQEMEEEIPAEGD
jgi:type I restriction enzyme S subunit